jgi:hypothetical protein
MAFFLLHLIVGAKANDCEGGDEEKVWKAVKLDNVKGKLA